MKEIELGYGEAEIYFIKKELENDASLLTEDVRERIDKSVDLLNGYSVMGYKWADFEPEFFADKILLKNTAATFPGKDINKHLSGCDKIYVFAATLGYGIDRIIRSFQVCDLSLSYYIDVLAGLLIEKLCDNVCKKIAENEDGRDITQRFSCGYGDFPLETQKDILNLLNAEKELGIKLTESEMMTPTKTVTAVLGAGKAGSLDRCAICVKKYQCEGNKCRD